jgi:dCMP deaminase
MIINAGIKKIYYQSGYTDSLAKELLAEGGIEIIQIYSDNRGDGS